MADEAENPQSRRVYVGNLPWSVTSETLAEHMKGGERELPVSNANVLTLHDGRSKGCAIVEYETAAAAKTAVSELTDSELEGRPIFVREDRETESSVSTPQTRATAQSHRVYVGNLSWDTSWQDLKDHCRQAGEAVHAAVMTESGTGMSKGCGIVEFATAEDAQTAIATLSETELNGRMIFVREDREAPSAASGGPRHTPHTRGSTSVHVRNLTPDTSWQDLKDHMRQAGNVDTATIATNSAGESIGTGTAVYQRAQDAARAIRELNGSELNGVTISVREDRNSFRGGGGRGGGGRGFRGGGRGGRGGGRGGAGPQDGTRLFVGNLCYDSTWRELKDHFRQIGDVRRVEVMSGPGGRSKGCGTVQFFTKEDAEAAISQLNGSELQGFNIEVRMDRF